MSKQCLTAGLPLSVQVTFDNRVQPGVFEHGCNFERELSSPQMKLLRVDSILTRAIFSLVGMHNYVYFASDAIPTKLPIQNSVES